MATYVFEKAEDLKNFPPPPGVYKISLFTPTGIAATPWTSTVATVIQMTDMGGKEPYKEMLSDVRENMRAGMKNKQFRWVYESAASSESSTMLLAAGVVAVVALALLARK